jgi:hypothetical protein
VEARALCHEARAYQEKGSPLLGGSLANMRKAFDLYEKAAEKDSVFARAYPCVS